MDPIHDEEALGKALDGRLLRRLWHWVLPYRLQIAATLLLVGPLFLIELAPAWVVKSGLDRALGEGGGDDPSPRSSSRRRACRGSPGSPVCTW